MTLLKPFLIALAVLLGCVALSIQIDDADCLVLEPDWNECAQSGWRG